jgi:hypothetical protein
MTCYGFEAVFVLQRNFKKFRRLYLVSSGFDHMSVITVVGNIICVRDVTDVQDW